jgi:uncharacterized protein YggE
MISTDQRSIASKGILTPFRIILVSSALMFSTFAQAQVLSLKDQTPHITVSGSAHIDVVPDLAILSFSVTTERATPSAAASDNAVAAQAVVAELKTQEIDTKDISTTSVTLQPLYDESRDLNGRIIKRTLRAYQARNALDVRVHAIDKAGTLAQRLIGKGANTFNCLTFEVEHPEPKLKALQAEAAKDALANAQSYADALGLKLLRVIEIAPNGDGTRGYAAVPAPMMAKMASPAEPEPIAIPMEPGVQRLETTVSITWELGP